MYLASLDLFGFKSFANRTHISFAPGVTAIVGPNGCGKSNLVDAVRWVLGEQRESILRSERMENVIFGGTNKRRPLGMAEISLTLHDTDGALPVEYEEVTLTRRLFRSGKSEYLLNKSVCRLRDFNDLFMGSGLSPESYSIIELKMVEDILSENPEVLRRLLDEAMGITRYKLRRREALRKLEEARLDQDRARDILLEVERQTRALQRQVARVRSYHRLKDKAQKVRLAVVLAHVRQLEANLDPLRQQMTTLRQEQESQSVVLTTAETELVKLETERLQSEEERARLTTHYGAVQVAYQTLLGEKIRQEEEIRSSSWKLEKNEEERTKISQELTDFETQLQEAAVQIDELRQNLPTLKDRFEQSRSAFDQADARYKELRQAARSDQEKLTTLRLRETETIRAVERQAAQRRSLEERHSALILRQADQEQRHQIKKGEITQIQTQIEVSQQNLDQARAQCTQLEREIEHLKTQQAQAQRDLDLQVARQSNLEMQIKHLLELRHRSLPMYSAGGQLAETFPEAISAALYDELEVDEPYLKAVETALQGMVFSRVLAKPHTLKDLLARLHQEKTGKAALLIGPPPELEEGSVLSFASKIGGQALTEFIKGRSLTAKWIRRLVRRTVALPNESDLHQWSNQAAKEGFILVALNGTLTDGQGVWIFGETKDEPVRVLGLSTRIEQLKEQHQQGEAQTEEIKSRINFFQKQLTSLAPRLQSAQEVLLQAESGWETFARRKLQIEAELVSANLLTEQIRRELQEVEAAQKELEIGIQEKHPDLPAISTMLQMLEHKIPQHEESETHALQARETAWQTLTETQLDYERVRSEAQRAQDRSEELQRRRGELRSRAQALAEEIVQLESRRKILTENLKEQTEKVDQAAAALMEVRQKLDDFDLSRREVQEMQKVQSARVREVRAHVEIISQNLHQSELQSVEYEATLREEQKKLEGVDLNTLVNEPADPDLLAKIERKILSLEPLNLAAELEYNEQLSRLNFLNDQLKDLQQAEADLQLTITTLNQEARERFESGFSRLRQNLQKIFAEVFEGGHADIKLTGEDALESRLELLAAPPGKRIGSLTLLSGGEKALTAISLLFAIYLEKPSPFCILDEVDAPLDDENTGRFSRMLKSFTQKTQFLVITHNKRTMTEAQQLLGITMEEEGVSKVVPVKLN